MASFHQNLFGLQNCFTEMRHGGLNVCYKSESSDRSLLFAVTIHHPEYLLLMKIILKYCKQPGW